METVKIIVGCLFIISFFNGSLLLYICNRLKEIENKLKEIEDRQLIN